PLPNCVRGRVQTCFSPRGSSRDDHRKTEASMSESTTHESHGLVVKCERGESKVTMTFTGVSDAPDPDTFLVPLLSKLGEGCKGAAVTLDFRDLDYMNSA